MIKVGFQGEVGAFSEMAVAGFHPEGCEAVPCMAAVNGGATCHVRKRPIFGAPCGTCVGFLAEPALLVFSAPIG